MDLLAAGTGSQSNNEVQPAPWNAILQREGSTPAPVPPTRCQGKKLQAKHWFDPKTCIRTQHSFPYPQDENHHIPCRTAVRNERTCKNYLLRAWPRVKFMTNDFTSPVAHMVKNLPVMWETQFRSLGQEDPLEKEMATHSSTLAWNIPWTEEPGRLQSMGSQKVRHDWETSLSLYNHKGFALGGTWMV